MKNRVVIFTTLIAIVMIAGFLVAKPKTPLPSYDLKLTHKDDTLIIDANPEKSLDGKQLQAEAFFVDSGGVHLIPRPPAIDDNGHAHLEGQQAALFPKAIGGKIILGMIVGRRDSMPSALEAWEELQSEGVPRPAFRVLTAPMALDATVTSTRGRSVERDRSDPQGQ